MKVGMHVSRGCNCRKTAIRVRQVDKVPGRVAFVQINRAYIEICALGTRHGVNDKVMRSLLRSATCCVTAIRDPIDWQRSPTAYPVYSLKAVPDSLIDIVAVDKKHPDISRRAKNIWVRSERTTRYRTGGIRTCAGAIRERQFIGIGLDHSRPCLSLIGRLVEAVEAQSSVESIYAARPCGSDERHIGCCGRSNGGSIVRYGSQLPTLAAIGGEI